MTTMTLEVGRDRKAATLSLRYTAIIAAGLALVWVMRVKSVVCPASASLCSADARLGPALAATAALLVVLAVVLALTVLVPTSRRAGPVRVITVGLITAGTVASIVVLVSAGFTLWPIWA